ncbi:hypothetical protein [Limimaricola cinnabarinus]|uniref:hypothetical protein n=1 Tax=Limimaricola cinnabarinus TaxID=1125964 RepID=UPI002FE0D0D2
MATPDIDLHPQWLGEWRQLRAALDAASRKPGGGDFDTFECRKLDKRLLVLAEMLETVKPTTISGAAAQLCYVLEVEEGEFTYPGHAVALNTVLSGLMAMA